jgi:hypothetical protein
VIGGVILIGVLADQQFTSYRERRAGLKARGAVEARAAPEGAPAE